MLFSALLLALVASVMQWSVTESHLNSRNTALLKARNDAEAVAEYGSYLVVKAFNSHMNPTFGAGSTTPVAFPATLASTFFGSDVSSTSIDVHAGTVTQVPAASMYYIDPRDPNNTYDPLSGRYVLRRDVTIIAKVAVTPKDGSSPVTACVQEKVSVRGAPLFAYAIFYSGNDLEVNPSPQMDIYGPVHVNGNLFVGTVGSAATTFHGPVTASGHVFHAWRGTTTSSQEGGSSMNSTTAVNFSTEPTGVSTANMLASGVWKDSTMGADSSTSGLTSLMALVTAARTAQFVTYASATWKGNLQTSAMGIQAYNPMGFSEIVGHNTTANLDVLATDDNADDSNYLASTTPPVYGHGYGPHSLIEPSITPAPPSTDPYQTAKLSIEEQKFANKAALYIKVAVTAANVGTITMYADPNSAPAGTPAANIGPNGGLKLGTPPANVIQFIPYTATGSGTSATVTKGMYDDHQAKPVNLVQINMAALKTALTDMTSATTNASTDILMADNSTKWGVGTLNGYEKYTIGSGGWNGGIYIEINSASTNHTGLLLGKGTVANGSSLVPSGTAAPNTVTGLTIATNAPIYILGNYNADGVISTATATNSALYPDDGHTGALGNPSIESPCALAGDAITILSPNYFGTDSSTGPTNDLAPWGSTATGAVTTNPSGSSAYSSPGSSTPNASNSVEIAAAFISGSTETTPSGTGSYSGGVHNMPRFLENWSSKTVAIRGALVNMYKNRIATGAWSSSYYSPPTRQWGFDQIFANGNFPPICPQVISYRRVDFTYLSPAAYATAASGM